MFLSLNLKEVTSDEIDFKEITSDKMAVFSEFVITGVYEAEVAMEHVFRFRTF